MSIRNRQPDTGIYTVVTVLMLVSGGHVHF